MFKIAHKSIQIMYGVIKRMLNSTNAYLESLTTKNTFPFAKKFKSIESPKEG
jgi:hypothetical protein